MTPRPDPFGPFRSGILALAAGFALVGCDGDWTAVPLRSDDELIAVFHQEHAAFDSLATMLGEDRDLEMLNGFAEHVQVRGAAYASYHEPGAALPGLPAERWNTYERLLRRIAVGHNVWNTDEGVLFQQYVAKFGPESSRWMRGYWYRRESMRGGRIVTSDLLADATYAGLKPHDWQMYRLIEGPWYLFTHKGYKD